MAFSKPVSSKLLCNTWLLSRNAIPDLSCLFFWAYSPSKMIFLAPLCIFRFPENYIYNPWNNRSYYGMPWLSGSKCLGCEWFRFNLSVELRHIYKLSTLYDFVGQKIELWCFDIYSFNNWFSRARYSSRSWNYWSEKIEKSLWPSGASIIMDGKDHKKIEK